MGRIVERKRLTSRLIKARNAVKLKHKLLKDGIARENLFATKLTAPLKEILSTTNTPAINVKAEDNKLKKHRLAKRLWIGKHQRHQHPRLQQISNIARKRMARQHRYANDEDDNEDDFWTYSEDKNVGANEEEGGGDEYNDAFVVKGEPAEDEIFEYTPKLTMAPSSPAVRNKTSTVPKGFSTPTGSIEAPHGTHKRVVDVSSSSVMKASPPPKVSTPLQQQKQLSPRDRLLEVSKTSDYATQIENYLRMFNIYARPHLRNMLTGNSEGLDNVYGPRIANSGQLTLGDNILGLDRNNVYLADGKVQVPASEGVMNLLFLRNPPGNSYTGEDLAYYRDLVIHSNVARQGFSSLRPPNTSGMKYKTLLKRLLNPDGSSSSIPRMGRGIVASSTIKPRFIYFDDPNELVNRLRLLMASQAAGHDAHDPEVVSIIDELKEGGYIL